VGSDAIYYSLLNTQAKVNQSGRYKNLLKGAPQIFFLRKQAKTGNFSSLNKKLSEIAKAVFQRSHLVVALGSDQSELAAMKTSIEPLLKALPSTPKQMTAFDFKNEMLFDGAAFSGQVQFMTLFGQSPKVASEYGLMKAVGEFLSLQYLHPKLREQGGAYGGEMIVRETGELGFYSYRDPRLDETYHDIMNVPEFLKSAGKDESHVTSAILRTVGDMDRPRTTAGEMSEGMRRYFSGITFDDEQTYRTQALHMDAGDITQASQVFQNILDHSQMSVVGFKPKLQASHLLKKIIDL
jgi:Zn-dependent M16 (insulinase) family peptidase